MRLMFVYWPFGNPGSAQTICGYIQVARALGHEVVVYAPEDTRSPFNCSLDIESADAVVFILEWNMYLHHDGHLNLVRLVGNVPRERRVVIDNDGMYNDAISINGDYNHWDTAASRWRIDLYDSLSDKIFQPTLHPLRSNVRSFLFHGYNPGWEVQLDFSTKEYGMIYVGNNWFRWRPMHRVLQAIEPIREQVGRIGLVGNSWAVSTLLEEAYYTNPAYLRRLGVEVMPAIPFGEVIGWMSRAIFNPVLVRPLFGHLHLVTTRMFETPAANTIPLFGQDRAFVREIYGDRAVELVLPKEDPQEKILDMLSRPEHYADIVTDIRQHLAEKHSHTARLQELIEIVES